MTNTTRWLYGFIAAFIGGGASAGSSWMGISIANNIGLDVPELNFNALGIIFLSSGIASGLAYLKQSPLPQIENNLGKGDNK